MKSAADIQVFQTFFSSFPIFRIAPSRSLIQMEFITYQGGCLENPKPIILDTMTVLALPHRNTERNPTTASGSSINIMYSFTETVSVFSGSYHDRDIHVCLALLFCERIFKLPCDPMEIMYIV